MKLDGREALTALGGNSGAHGCCAAQASGNTTYGQKAEHNIQLLHKLYPDRGLLPSYISPQDGSLLNNHITFGAMGDSYYECGALPPQLRSSFLIASLAA